MRNDMYKVIVERPRRGGHGSTASRRVDNHEDSPRCEGLRKRHRDRKWLNENLRPLERYLASQVGRPWRKVYAEICEGIDRRNTVQQHIHQHLQDFVAVRVVHLDGVPCVADGWRGPTSLEGHWQPRFFVDPIDGLLKLNRLRLKARRAWHADRQREADAAGEDRRNLGPLRQLHRLDGLWYAVDLAPIPERTGGHGVLDVVRKRLVLGRKEQGIGKKFVGGDATRYGRGDVYACSKRQLSAKELAHHDVANTAH